MSGCDNDDRYDIAQFCSMIIIAVCLMIIVAENIWNQIEQKELCYHFMKQERVKTALRAFTYSYVDIYDKQYSHDKKKINVIKQHCEKYMILM